MSNRTTRERRWILTGGVICLNNPQLTLANHLWFFTSLAPEFDPIRLCSSLINNFRIDDLHRLVTGVLSGYVTSFFSTLAKVAFLFGPLNGVVANLHSARFMLEQTKSTYNHLVYQNTQGPPIHGGSVATALNHLWRDILLCPNKRVCPEVGYT